MRYVVQWEYEDTVVDKPKNEERRQFGLAYTEFGPIAAKFQCPELMKSDCLRFVDTEVDTIFNCRQANTIDKEIEILLSLDLTEEEREDCLDFQETVSFFPKQNRNLLYLRIYPNPYSETA